MPYEMSRDFAYPVSFHVMLSVSVAAPLFPHANVNETPTPMSMKRIKELVVADRDRRIRDGRKTVPETLNALGHCVRLFEPLL